MNQVLNLQKLPQAKEQGIEVAAGKTITLTITGTVTAFWSTQSNHC